VNDNQKPFGQFDLRRAIELRWALRDIRSSRLKLSPVSDEDLRILGELGLVEVRDGVPALTETGQRALD
jgi:hypothetical protein